MNSELNKVHLLPPLPTAQQRRWRWLLPDAAVPAEGELDELRTALAHWTPQPSLVLLLPAESAFTALVHAPSRKPHHVRAAVPNLVEEWLADDLENLHIAIGSQNAAGEVAVAALAKPLLQDWLQALDTAGLAPHTADLDALRLPWRAGEIAVVVRGRSALLRWNECQTAAFDLDQLKLLLDHLLTQWPAVSERPQTLTLYLHDDTPEHHTSLTSLLSAMERNHRLSCTQQRVAGDATAWLCRNPSAPLELLQGEFATLTRKAQYWQRWRPALYLAGVLMLLQMVFNVGAGMWLERRAEHWHAQSTALYRALFPGDSRLVNIRQQLQNHLDQGHQTTTPPFLVLIGQLAVAIQAAAAEPPIQLRSLTFDTNTGLLVAELVVPSITSMDTLQKQLKTQGLTATIVSATNENDRVIGRLRVGGN